MLWTLTLKRLARELRKKYLHRGLKIAFAESCTGGLAASILTSLSGVSDFFLGSAVVYSNETKHRLLGVPLDTLREWGAVSPQTAKAMAQGLQVKIGSDIALSITGIAGPEGGTREKPVGLVWFCFTQGEKNLVWKRIFKGRRERIQRLSVKEVFKALLTGPPVDSQ